MTSEQYEKVKADSMIALADPQPGDCWQEVYSWWMYVVKRDGDLVYTLCGGAPITFPEEGKAEIRTREEFRTWLTYHSIPTATWAFIDKRGGDISWMEGYDWKRFKRVGDPPRFPLTLLDKAKVLLHIR